MLGGNAQLLALQLRIENGIEEKRSAFERENEEKRRNFIVSEILIDLWFLHGICINIIDHS